MITYVIQSVDVCPQILDRELKVQYPDNYSSLDYGSSNLTLRFSNSVDNQVLQAAITTHSNTYKNSFDYIFEHSMQTQEAAINFGRQLLHDWMRKNTLEGMSVKQSLWVFSRFESFTLQTEFGQKHVDLFKMFYAGAIPTVYYTILRVVPDDMTQSYHWLNQARLDWVKDRIKEYLSPQMISYLENLT
jgi:hypothetical protein